MPNFSIWSYLLLDSVTHKSITFDPSFGRDCQIEFSQEKTVLKSQFFFLNIIDLKAWAKCGMGERERRGWLGAQKGKSNYKKHLCHSQWPQNPNACIFISHWGVSSALFPLSVLCEFSLCVSCPVSLLIQKKKEKKRNFLFCLTIFPHLYFPSGFISTLLPLLPLLFQSVSFFRVCFSPSPTALEGVNVWHGVRTSKEPCCCHMSPLHFDLMTCTVFWLLGKEKKMTSCRK